MPQAVFGSVAFLAQCFLLQRPMNGYGKVTNVAHFNAIVGPSGNELRHRLTLLTFQLLFAFVILGHDRRRPIHFAVTSNPTSEWTARQLLEAFPWDNAPRYLLRHRDGAFGEKFCETSKSMSIHEVLTAPQSPWQNSYVERWIGSIRRECLDHVIVFHEAGLRRILKDYFEYYEKCRTHLSLEKDAPVSRPVELPSLGEVIEIPKVGGLHHLYTRKAA